MNKMTFTLLTYNLKLICLKKKKEEEEAMKATVRNKKKINT